MNEKTCKTCYYSRGKKCSIMHSPIPECWADEAEARRRAKEIREYTSGGRADAVKTKRVYTREVAESLEKNFNQLYAWGLNDVQIAERLGVSQTSVQRYRQKLSLPTNNNKKEPPCWSRNGQESTKADTH